MRATTVLVSANLFVSTLTLAALVTAAAYVASNWSQLESLISDFRMAMQVVRELAKKYGISLA